MLDAACRQARGAHCSMPHLGVAVRAEKIIADTDGEAVVDVRDGRSQLVRAQIPSIPEQIRSRPQEQRLVIRATRSAAGTWMTWQSQGPRGSGSACTAYRLNGYKVRRPSSCTANGEMWLRARSVALMRTSCHMRSSHPYRRPCASRTYALTVPGSVTSTRTSTRVNAL
jgi:hypothetical protein